MVQIAKKLMKLVCQRCKHTWTPRKAEVRVCPGCGSAWWDKPRRAAPEAEGGKGGA